MLKNIILSETEATNLCLIIEGNTSEFNKMSNEEKTTAINNQREAHEHHVDCFRDISGNAYVVMHGGEYYYDGKIYGEVDYHGKSMYVDKAYDIFVESGFIKDGETLHLICCFGAGVKECQERRVAGGYARPKPIVYENDTHTECWSRACRLRGGTVRYTIGTRNTLIEKIKYKFVSSF
jgi:hypothetical protein